MLIDLINKYLSKDIMDKYSTGIAPKLGLVGDKIVTMVSIFVLKKIIQ